MLELKSVTKKFLVFPAVDAVSFSVQPGEVLGYLGPNGAGKTTTLRMIAGLLKPTEGDILYRGRKLGTNDFDYKSRLGYVPENSPIYPHLSASDYLGLVGRLRSIPESLLKMKIARFVDLFGLSAEMHTPLSSFSKGMAQKILLSSALLHDPEVLLLDEPLSGLDVTSAMVIKDLIQGLAEEGKIIIYSSHVLEVVEKVCHRVIVLHEGRIVADDTVDGLKNLMRQPSLEKIFSRLIHQEDTAAKAVDLISAMKMEA